MNINNIDNIILIILNILLIFFCLFFSILFFFWTFDDLIPDIIKGIPITYEITVAMPTTNFPKSSQLFGYDGIDRICIKYIVDNVMSVKPIIFNIQEFIFKLK